MKKTRPAFHRKFKIIAGIFLLTAAILAGAFFAYVSDYYRADELALEVMAQGENISVQGKDVYKRQHSGYCRWRKNTPPAPGAFPLVHQAELPVTGKKPRFPAQLPPGMPRSGRNCFALACPRRLPGRRPAIKP